LSITKAVDKYVDTIGTHYASGSLGQLESILKLQGVEDIAGELETRISEWEGTKAGKFTKREIVRSGEKFVVATGVAGGFTTKRWKTVGPSCPYCLSMDGRIVSIESAFLNKGATLMPVPNIIAGAQAGMLIKRRISAPPAHDTCDCTTILGV
jgi:hypothetical protein